MAQSDLRKASLTVVSDEDKKKNNAVGRALDPVIKFFAAETHEHDYTTSGWVT
jgi:hypothetical protein